MLMSMSIVNDTVKLLTNINNGTNTLIINNSTIPESSWVGDGYYTVGNIRIQKISANTGNIHLIKINDLNYKLATKNTSSRIFASDVVYDNATSGTQEDDLQGALDELYDKLDDMHPVGSIFFSVTSTNPSTYFGGTWVRISKGRVLVGVDENDTAFDTAEETGGSKTNSHTHTATTAGTVNGHAITINEMPSHRHYTQYQGWGVASAYGDQAPAMLSQDGNYRYTNYQGGGQAHSHGFTGAQITTSSISDTNNLQPYLAVYIWKRTA